MSNDTVVLTGDQIDHWVILSRLHQLALEINTGLKVSRMPMLKALYIEGWIPEPMRGTYKNKCIVLRAMLAGYVTLRPDYIPGDGISRAVI